MIKKVAYFGLIALIFFFASCRKKVNALPVLTTLNVVAITSDGATCGGAVFGKNITDKGVCWNLTGNPTVADNITLDGSGDASYISTIYGLNPATDYYLCAYATNDIGTGYGEVKKFRTAAITGSNTSGLSVPVVVTNSASSIGQNSANVGGSVTFNGNSSILEQGICWSSSPNPTIFNQKISCSLQNPSFYCSIGPLSTGKTYYRAFAKNAVGTSYGTEYSFTASGTVTDYDGNVYNTVVIGSQEWMTENLRTTHFRNGTLIPEINSFSNSVWNTTTSPAMCNFNDNTANATSYGSLYNFYVAADSRNIAPPGWHVPSSSEWTTLINYLGGTSSAGNKMMEASTLYWNNPPNATNESRFSARGAGFRDSNNNGSFVNFQTSTVFLSTYNVAAGQAWTVSLDRNGALLYTSSKSNNGMSIRCVKD